MKKTVKVPYDVLQSLMDSGRLMSNVCYNLSQRDSMPQHERQSMAELTRRWDANCGTVSSYFPVTVIKTKT